MEKRYYCNNELANIFYAHGFKDATHKDDINKKPAKLRFAIKGKPSRSMRFDYDNLYIVLSDRQIEIVNHKGLDCSDLKLILTFFKLDYRDLHTMVDLKRMPFTFPNKKLTLESISLGLQKLRDELVEIQTSNSKPARAVTLKRILDTHDTIKIE